MCEQAARAAPWNAKRPNTRRATGVGAADSRKGGGGVSKGLTVDVGGGGGGGGVDGNVQAM